MKQLLGSTLLTLALYTIPATAQVQTTPQNPSLEYITTQSWGPVQSKFNGLSISISGAFGRKHEPIPNLYPSIVEDPLLAIDGNAGDFHLVHYVDECMRLYHRDLRTFFEENDTKESERIYAAHDPRHIAVRLPDTRDFKNIRVTYAGDPIPILEDNRYTIVEAEDIFFDYTPQGETEPIHYRVTRPKTGVERETDGVTFSYPTYNELLLIMEATRNHDLKNAKWELLHNPAVENIIPKPRSGNKSPSSAVSAEYMQPATLEH